MKMLADNIELHENKISRKKIHAATSICQRQTEKPLPWQSTTQVKLKIIIRPVVSRGYLFRVLVLDAAFDETLAARDVEVDAALLSPLTALTCLFYQPNS